jgi:hypothetical protein
VVCLALSVKGGTMTFKTWFWYSPGSHCSTIDWTRPITETGKMLGAGWEAYWFRGET